MPFRVTQQSVARATMAGLRRANQNLSVAQERLATQRRINRLSDAPLDAARAHRLRAHASKLGQHQRNLDEAQHQIEFAASALQQASDLFVEARDVCIRAANAATDAAERQSFVDAAEQLIESLVRRANADYNGRYVFAGSADDAEPFAAQRAGGYVVAVDYQGNGEAVELEAGPRARVATGEPGTLVFGGEGQDGTAFDALIELRDLLRNTEGLSESELTLALSDHLEKLDVAHGRIIDSTARFGWRASQLEFTRTVLDNASLADAASISELEDADFAEAAALLYQQEAALQTALMVSARIMQNTLLEYLE